MKLILISFFLIGFIVKINLINGLSIFGELYSQGKIANNYLANKYCDSLEKNLFKGLDKESTLKYEYFFSSIPDDYIKEENKFLEIFKSDVKSICSYDITKSNEKEFKSFLDNYVKTRSSTPKIKVEAINPTPINPAMIPVFR
ncbi:hypothetical protein EU95_0979 [Prochlorococcus marinus str. MIT 9201]|uniref:Uncharacterized protein n=1 Tax=Prochlorococcus marinus str. MIT 9201 TaxID=93057 RepID=A0A0A2A6P9_PROMR|nr:hypothetical protein [Prochlorococcus marinus]KGF96184.1 hypothetical protein EU95_0979 [Prochlorococcus marinus str. MIT 9201]